jgi:hypothetical protein
LGGSQFEASWDKKVYKILAQGKKAGLVACVYHPSDDGMLRGKSETPPSPK